MSVRSQFFPPRPKFTEEHLPNLQEKVYIVTGAVSGIGLELAKLLYQRNGIVYLGSRSFEKFNYAASTIESLYPNSNGRLESLQIDLADLNSIRTATRKFLSQEPRLDVLFHNAGVMVTPIDSKSVQGHELQLATHVIGPYLLTRLLEPILISTATKSPPASVRIVWVSSLVAIGTPHGGILWEEKAKQPKLHNAPNDNYMQSKAGMVYLAHEDAKRLEKEGIVCVSLHPGLVTSGLQKNFPAPVRMVMGAVFKEPRFGAYTVLFAGFSPDIKVENGGRFIVPWGRFGRIPDHIATGMKPIKEGGSGTSEQLELWCDIVTRAYQ